MQNLYLSPDETILLTNQNIVVDGIRHEAVLTTRRLILIREDDPKAPIRELPLDAIGSALAGENALREPTITLILTTAEGGLWTLELVFIRLVSEQKNQQYNEWVNRLKERVRVTINEPETIPSGTIHNGLMGGSLTPKELPVDERHQVHGGAPQIPGYVFRPLKPVLAPQESNGTKIVLLIIVVAAVAIAVFALTQFLHANPTVPPGSSGSALAPTVAVATTVPPLSIGSPSPTATVQTTQPPVPRVIIPPSGVWVMVHYPGHYIGYVGSRGSMREVNATGDRFFQIPAVGGIIEAEIKKVDGSGNLLAVETYHDGTLIQRINTTAPFGVLYLHSSI